MTNGITFILAVQIDCSDRLDNLDITLEVINNNFPRCKVILLEADTTQNLARRYSWCEHVFVNLAPGEMFNKTKLYNLGASMASTSVICFVDADVPPSKTAILKAYDLIASNVYDVVYPYAIGEGYDVPKRLQHKILEEGDIYCFDSIKYPWLLKEYRMPYVESGGLIVFNTAAYCFGGGGNERFVGWGCEDDELLSRFSILGYRIGRLDDYILLHLKHRRWANTMWHDHARYEIPNRYRLANIRCKSREELHEITKEWNNFGSPYPVDKKLSVVISGSCIEHHPEITFIRDVIDSLRLTGIPLDTPIILSHDNIKPDVEGFEEKEKAYQQYFINLQEYVKTCIFSDIKIIKAEKWGHLTRSLKNAVGHVTTKYMLVLQHDIHVRRDIPVMQMIDLMEKYKHIKHLRFNVRKNHPTFMWWDGYLEGKKIFAEEEYDGIKLCVTPAWSDQNHLATKEYYENVVFPDCTNLDGELIYDFMENRLNGMCHHNHSRYGTYIYGEYGAPRTSRHSDGRKSSPEPDED